MTRDSIFPLLQIVFYLTLLTVIGCARQDPGDLPSVAWESVPARVNYSDNPLPPPWQFSIAVEIGSESGPDEYLLRSPFALTVLSGGSIVVGDDKPLQLRVYDIDGTHVASFAQPGAGPGDLTPGPFGWLMHPVGERSFQLLSGWPPRVQEWTVSGELLSVETIASDHPIMLGTAPRTAGFIEDELFWISSSYRSDSENRTVVTSHVLVGDIQGIAVDTLASIPHESVPSEHQMVVQFGFDYASLLKDHVLVTQATRCYVASWLEDWITEIDLQRRVPLSRFRWVHEPDSIQESMSGNRIRELGESDRELLADGLTWLRERVSLLGIAEGPDGQILVQRTGGPVGDQWPTDVFSAEGDYMGRVLLPVEPRTTVIRGRDLYGIGANQGIPVIRILHIDLPQ